MSKTKIDPRVMPDMKQIVTFDDANQTLLELGKIEATLQDKEAELNGKIQELRDKFDLATAEHVQIKEMLSAQLEKFALNNKNEFEKERSRELLHGEIGFRFSPPKISVLNRKYNFGGALEILERLKWGKDYVRTKKEIDKEALLAAYSAKEIDDTKLANAGLRVESNEKFFYNIFWERFK